MGVEDLGVRRGCIFYHLSWTFTKVALLLRLYWMEAALYFYSDSASYELALLCLGIPISVLGLCHNHHLYTYTPSEEIHSALPLPRSPVHSHPRADRTVIPAAWVMWARLVKMGLRVRRPLVTAVVGSEVAYSWPRPLLRSPWLDCRNLSRSRSSPSVHAACRDPSAVFLAGVASARASLVQVPIRLVVMSGGGGWTKALSGPSGVVEEQLGADLMRSDGRVQGPEERGVKCW